MADETTGRFYMPRGALADKASAGDYLLHLDIKNTPVARRTMC
ncbi:hypothetical protein PAMC26510_04485 [Caballeronia sordidicola]|uniref:Uncharacterized protein n=1 Tax=Caballeronia sordidicola TaxID=196367 RepID=A0A242N8N9_CABSO|nr:hypothetical protein PAMC26510_04485 [Caballeronia sordidicola]